jgi:hypothetical protein
MRIAVLVLTILTLVGLGSGATPDAHAMTPEQCQFFAVGGRVAVCHATGSAKNPYVRITPSIEACEAHAEQHPGDYTGATDPQCLGGNVCLSEGSPCDATLGCCSGLACTAGTCTR